MDYWLGDRDSIPDRSKIDVFLFHRVQTGSKAHINSYRVGNGEYFTGVIVT
jgi:hypothetical protein